MKKWISFLILICCLTGIAVADEAHWDLKGVKLGMTEAEVRDLFQGTEHDVDCFSPSELPGLRLCSVSNLTFADGPIESFRLILNEEKVMTITVNLKESRFLMVAEAIKTKYGTPASLKNKQVQNRMGAVFNNHVIVWSEGDMRLIATQRGQNIDTSTIDLSSKAAIKDRFEKHKLKAKSAASDL